MHNLTTNIARFREILIQAYGADNLYNGNFRRYPNSPKASDIEIVAIAIAAEAMEIESENNHFKVLRCNYSSYYKLLPDRSNFNRRRRKLQPFIDDLSQKISEEMTLNEDTFIINSMPLPICRFARHGRTKIMKEDLEFQPTSGYLPIDKTNYYGFKLHLVVSSKAVVSNFSITQANVHDIRNIEAMTKDFLSNAVLIGDKGYIGKNVQLNLFQEYSVKLITPKRNNQIGPDQWNSKHRKMRKLIETTFSQFCDQFSMKKNFAKSFCGYFSRITSKIAAYTCLQFINSQENKPINHLKNALAF